MTHKVAERCLKSDEDKQGNCKAEEDGVLKIVRLSPATKSESQEQSLQELEVQMRRNKPESEFEQCHLTSLQH